MRIVFLGGSTLLQHSSFLLVVHADVVGENLDFERGRRIYEIEFYKDGFEYEYDIDAVTGKVLKFKKDWD